MTTTRVTQSMMVNRSVDSLQLGLSRLAAVQQQLSSGKRLNRPSDSPTDTTSAMRLRASLKSNEQYTRNADDGIGRLGLADQTMFNVTDELINARNLALQGANTGGTSQSSRDAMAAEIDQIRDGLLADANTTYLSRPVFGGTTSGTVAFDPAGNFVGDTGQITRRVGEDVKVRVDVDGKALFGDGPTSVFAELDALSTALRAGNGPGVQAGLTALANRMTTASTVHASIGAAYKRLEQAQNTLGDKRVSLTNSLSELENVDLARTSVDLNMQEVAYQAALASTSKVLQHSLMDFMR